ncbi:platelet-activating factor acetylhydrolase, isoform II domain-containing protein [Hirsutella rhossiliensis]|uniref:1-alkyl-2-acetylglycerophosphocholine esterase n=1 Tax=Hirsutella rhossiliensis TaxID=111463 RepID=A0A9P8N5A8_9HYPO|nr:platelet-activating factor acetylhydrolase, isoform II domain-containing protein [Hirsutella rhossiliensis]KAH0967120.1 platelet-activating factor acetylhydrolase, isoform II domain-containing protein [Hirsutella rhossiliensis]
MLLQAPLFFSAIATALLVPEPTGPFSVAMRVQALTDTSRHDSLDPTGKAQTRRVLISMFLPIERQGDACPIKTVQYMTPSVAAAYGKEAVLAGLPSDFFRSFELQICDLARNPGYGRQQNEGRAYPLVLYTPGLGHSRLIYGAMARSLASQGYVVVTVDHPYDANLVEFPDGRVVLGANISDDDPIAVGKVVQIRNDDLSFVLDQLHDKSVLDNLVANFPGTIDLGKIVVFGHSLGGAAAAALTRSDHRVLGGVDLDGMLVDPIKSLGLRKPFLLAGRVNHSTTDHTWNEFWPHLDGRRMELAIKGTAHGSFSDRPILLSTLKLPEKARQEVEKELGTINAKRLDEVLNGVLTSFFDLALYREKNRLGTINRTFPEVFIQRSHL